MILNELFGNETAEKVLLFLGIYGSGNASQIAQVFGVPVSQVQRQLLKLERGGILSAQSEGKTRVFQWNPRLVVLEELRPLLRKAVAALPLEIQKKYFRVRQRPRRTGKE